MCGIKKNCNTTGHCRACEKKWQARKKELAAEGFYKNMEKLKQPRYFNFL